MPTNYTEQDAANTAVRAFLSSIGGSYLDTGKWNTGSGQGEKDWQKIKEYFSNQCAYCGADDKPLMREHLVMLNREQCGLHHPGNVVPCCKKCNTRRRNDGKYPSWSEQLQIICKKSKASLDIYNSRLKRIETHMKNWKYPVLDEDLRGVIQTLSESLYQSSKAEFAKSEDIFRKLQNLPRENRED